MLRSQSPLPPPTAPLPTTTSLFFITCVFSSLILPVLSAVSKIDWGLLCILVHVGMVARVCSLSICLGCQGVSWVPSCLLLNIYHLFNVVAVPGELDSASNTSHPLPLSLSRPFLHTFLSLHMLFFTPWSLASRIFWCTLSPMLTRVPKHVYNQACRYLFSSNRPWTSRLRLLHHNRPPLFRNLSRFKSHSSDIMGPLLEKIGGEQKLERDVEGEGVPIPGK